MLIPYDRKDDLIMNNFSCERFDRRRKYYLVLDCEKPLLCPMPLILKAVSVRKSPGKLFMTFGLADYRRRAEFMKNFISEIFCPAVQYCILCKQATPVS